MKNNFNMKKLIGLFLSLVYIVLHFDNVLCQYSGYHRWTPSNNNREDLLCPDSCAEQADPKQGIECCACHSKTCWEINPHLCNVTIARLHIEYSSETGSSILLRPETAIDPTYYEFEHISGRMSSMPANLCEFPNLVSFVAPFNRIKSIGNISCLRSINTLDLRNNRIEVLPNKTFSALYNLKVLNLKNNNIQKIDANTFHLAIGTIYSVDISFNPVHEIDITNIIVAGEFCDRNFHGTRATELKNENTFKVNTSSDTFYGPGFLNFSSSSLGYTVNLTDIGIPFRDADKYLDLSFTAKDSEAGCDCALVPLLQNILYPQIRMWVDLVDNFTCNAPERMKGFTINQIVDLDLLVCEVEVNCPRPCTCTDQQNKGVVLVDCSHRNLTKMPDVMPVGFWNNNKLILNLDGNAISTFEDKEYLDRVEMISFADNPIQNIAQGTFNKLSADITVDISSMQTESLPVYIQKKNPHHIKFGDHPIQCDCSNVWVGDWIRSYNAPGLLYCNINGYTLDAFDFTMENNQCDDESNVSIYYYVGTGCFFTLVIMTIFLIYNYRYELCIITRRARSTFINNIYHENRVFISFDSALDIQEHLSMSIEKWVLSKVKHRLNQYRVDSFTPNLDITPGENRSDAVLNNIQSCQTYIIILTKSYLKNQLTIEDFNLIWQQYWKDSNKHIILINYDYTASTGVKNRQMKALIRVGVVLDFTDTSDKMLARIEKRIKRLTGAKEKKAW